VVTAKTDSALIEFLKELRGSATPSSSEDLRRAKKDLQLGLPSSFETTQGIASEFLPLIATESHSTFFASASSSTAR
jgi:predicted Zn-dependent peptidase